MKLREFISQALQDIVGGVQDAQESLPEPRSDYESPIVSPPVYSSKEGMALMDSRPNPGYYPRVELVAFDIGVTVAEGKQTQGGIGIVVGPVAVGSKGQSTSQNNQISRIQFTVPVKLPMRALPNKAS